LAYIVAPVDRFADGLSALQAFCHAATQKSADLSAIGLAALQPDIALLAASGDIKRLLERTLQTVPDETAFPERLLSDGQMLLVDDALFSLSLELLQPAAKAAATVSDFAFDVLLQVLGPAPLPLALHLVPPARVADLFDANLGLTRQSMQWWPAGSSILLESGRHVAEFGIVTDTLVLRLVRKQLASVVWVYEAASLQAMFSVAADLQASRMRTAITLLQQLSARLGADADTLANLQQLSNHPLHYVRWAAIQTLFALDRPLGTQALEVALHDAHPHVRNAAQRSWQRLQALEENKE
jgi:hypothetical protein